MNTGSRRRVLALPALLAFAALGFALVPTAPDAGDVLQDTTEATEADPVQLVTVRTPTRADKDLLTTLGLDLTEHAGHDYVEVVLHGASDADVLRAAGLTWDVRIADMAARQVEINEANRAYAASTAASPLPSGRTTYRTVEDYDTEMEKLAERHPDTVRLFELAHKSLEGKPVVGLEIARDVHEPEDGRPVFVMLGLHHAREWPSGEHTIEFAYDLLAGNGTDPRITDLLERTRVVIVPVVNPDGFEKSVNDGMLVDLREVDDEIGGDGTVAILGTPGNAYKRKNCRIVDGQEPVAGECAVASPGGFGVGVDLNRNYGGFWGGPGASNQFAWPTYRGAAPFSEPETQNIRELVSARHVTTLVTNHTFSNLVLRPNGVHPDTIGPDGHPVGDAPDEPALKDLGARMAANNGYRNIHGWELYDTTGTTEDWSYNATGGFGYTFEIGADEFHPPYPEVVDEYLGAGEYAGKGNREAFFVALGNTVDTANHAVLAGKAPAGATLRLRRSAPTPTWSGQIDDTVDTTMVVGADRRYTWHVNPSTRPAVMARQIRVTAEEPLASQAYTGTTPPLGATEEELVVAQDADLLEVTLDWPTPDDLDLYVLREENGELVEVASSTNFTEKERALVEDPQPGRYVLRVVNYASVAPSWDMTASLFEATEETIGGLVEEWTLTCERDGEVLEERPVVVDRGQQAKVDLKACRSAWKKG